MSRTIAAFLVVAGLPLAVVAQPEHGRASDVPAAPAPAAGASISFDHVHHDFGKVFDDAKVSTTFTFTNVGTAQLVISDVQGSCSCTVAELEKREYAPGESGVIHVEFDPRNRRGAQHRTVIVTSNDPNTPRFTLNVDATVRPLIDIDPTLVRFGQVARNEAQTMLVDITGVAPGFDLVSAIVTRGEGITVDTFDTEDIVVEDEPARRASILVNFLSSQLGTVSGQVTLTLTDANGANIVKGLSVMAEVVGDITVLPNRLNLGLMQAGASWERQVRVTSKNGQPFHIKGVQEKPMVAADGTVGERQLASLTYDVVPAAEGREDAYIVTIRGDLPPDAVGVTTDLVLVTDMPGEDAVPMRLTGRVRETRPALSAGGQGAQDIDIKETKSQEH